MINLSPLLREMQVSININTSKKMGEKIAQVLPEVCSNALLQLAYKTKSVVREKLEETRKNPHDANKPKIIDSFGISGPVIEGNNISVGLGKIETLERRTPWYKYQETGVAPYSYTRTYNSLKEVNIEHPGMVGRGFISAGFVFLETEGEDFLRQRIEEGLSNIKDL